MTAPAIPVLVVDCGGYDVLGVAWCDLARAAGAALTATDGPAHIAPGVVSLHDAYAFAPALDVDVTKAIAVKGYKLPGYAPPPTTTPTTETLYRLLPHDGWPMIAIADDGRTWINWRALRLKLDGYTGPRPPAVSGPHRPFADTVDVRDVVEVLQANIGQHWKIPQVLVALAPRARAAETASASTKKG